LDQDIQKSAQILKDKLGEHQPKMAFLMGSGLNEVAHDFDSVFEVSYTALPGFPSPTTKGHAGKVTAALIDGICVLFLQGRLHYYEGVGMEPMKVLVRTLKSIGIETFFLTNAAGSTNATTTPGSLVAVHDHINLPQFDPLCGPNDDQWGPRFLDAAHLWNADLRKKLHKAAEKANVKLGEGIFAMFSGPSFETAAEVRMVKMMGADTVGMSLVPEALLAHHCGLNVVGCSAITNLANGLTQEPLSHEHTLKWAKVAKEQMSLLIRSFVSESA
jgi:xanthosine phosphorylase